MIWVIVVSALVSPLLGVGLAWWIIRMAMVEFQGHLLSVVQEQIRLQDDRIRKVKASEKSRKGPEDDGISFDETPAAAMLYPGQPVE